MATPNIPIDRNGCGCFLLSFFAVMNLCAGQTETGAEDAGDTDAL